MTRRARDANSVLFRPKPKFQIGVSGRSSSLTITGRHVASTDHPFSRSVIAFRRSALQASTEIGSVRPARHMMRVAPFSAGMDADRDDENCEHLQPSLCGRCAVIGVGSKGLLNGPRKSDRFSISDRSHETSFLISAIDVALAV